MSDKSQPFIPERIRRQSESAHELLEGLHDASLHNIDDEYDEEDELGLGSGGGGEIELNLIEKNLKTMFNFQAR